MNLNRVVVSFGFVDFGYSEIENKKKRNKRRLYVLEKRQMCCAQCIDAGLKVFVFYTNRLDSTLKGNSKPTLRQLCDLICSDLTKALSRRLDAGIEAFRKLAASFREVYAANLRLKFRPPIHIVILVLGGVDVQVVC